MENIFDIKIITPETSAQEVVELSLLSDPSDEDNYRKLMAGFIANSLSPLPDLDAGIVYCVYRGSELIASARIKQDDYTFRVVSIEYIAVKPEYQGQGIGTFFLEGLFNEIKECWHKEVAMLATGHSRTFYEKAGMSLLGELEGGSDNSRFYMYKQLG